MSFDKLIYESSVSYFIGQCRLVSAYYNSSYHIAPLDFGEGGAIVLLSACFLALSRTRWGLGMVPLVRLKEVLNENYLR